VPVVEKASSNGDDGEMEERDMREWDWVFLDRFLAGYTEYETQKEYGFAFICVVGRAAAGCGEMGG